MTTESLLTKPERAVRVAPSVLAGIGAFTAVGVYAWSVRSASACGHRSGPGPGLFPFAMGGVLVAMSALWLVQELRRPSEKAEGIDRGVVISVVVSLVVLASLMDLLGFQLSMFRVPALSPETARREELATSVIIALAGSVGAFYAFNYGLNVALPVSAFTPLNLIGL